MSDTKDMRQLLDRGCTDPMDPILITEEEKQKAMESFTFMDEKKDGTIKIPFGGEWKPAESAHQQGQDNKSDDIH